METLVNERDVPTSSLTTPNVPLPKAKVRLPKVLQMGQEVFWVASGQVAAALGGFGSVYFLTGCLSKHAFGDLAFGIALATLLQGYFSSIANGFLRYMPVAKESAEVGPMVQSVRSLLIYGTLWHAAITVVSLLLAAISGFGNWIPFLLFTSLLALLTGYVSAIENLQIGLRQRSVIAVVRGSMPWVRTACVVGVVYAFPHQSMLSPGSLAIIGLTLGTLVVFLMQLWKFRQSVALLIHSDHDSSEQHKNWIRKIVNYSLPFGAVFILAYVQMFADRWALKVFTSSGELGLYSAVYQLGFAPMILLAGFTAQLMGPILFGRAGDASRNDQLQRSLSQNKIVIQSTVVFGVLCAGVAYFTHEWAFQLVLREEYWSVSKYLPWIVLSGGLFAAGNAASISSMIAARPQVLVMPMTIAATAALIATFTGAYLGGLAGVFIAMPVHFAIHFLVMFYSTRLLQQKAVDPVALS